MDTGWVDTAEADTSALTTSLHSLGTDCLRLSTHFFHSIQQCAQQVYHTALPLSPTSSKLRRCCLQSVTDSQLSCITAFLGAPDTWGLLLRTIDARPRQLTCIATSLQMIVAACEGIVNVYDAVTFVPRQSLPVPGIVRKILSSPDGSTLFFAHSHTATMWDLQTGGLTHTFFTLSKITDIAVSTKGDHIACGSSDGSVTFWNIHTKERGKGFGDGQPVVAVCWLSPDKLAVATQRTVYIHSIATGKTLNKFTVPGCVWGMVYSRNEGEFLVGASRPGEGADQNLYSLSIFEIEKGHVQGREPKLLSQRSPTYSRRLLNPTLVDREIMCITPPSGVQSFNPVPREWTNNPPLLDAAISVAASLNRNLVVQTKDSIQIFSLDVMTSHEARSDVRPSHVYPLGEKHIVCLLQPNRHITLLELGTLRELRPEDNTSPLESLSMNQSPHARASFGRGLVAEFGLSRVIQAWESGTPLPERTEAADEDAPLSRLSPECTQVVTVYGTEGEPVPLSEPRETPPYTLDENCEWVVDAKSRKICWISPGNVRRGDGGHFWAGLELVMVGDDGVVRKVSFREPDS